MRGSRAAEPDGISADCFYVLAMYGGQDTAAGLHAAIDRENTSLDWAVPTLGQVRSGLLALSRRRPPLAEQVPGRRGWWRITPHGYRMLAVWCGDDEPVRIPCGLGWPGGAGSSG